MQRAYALAGACLLMLALAPQGAAPVYTGPLAFYFESSGCNAGSFTPPGATVVHLANANGIVWGDPVSSPSVLMYLQSGGFVLCEPFAGGYRTYGDGEGVIVA